MLLPRIHTKQIAVGSVKVGGDAPISVQSMTNTDTRDVEATVRQIRELVRHGCDIVRLGVPDAEAARALGEIRRAATVPLIADIHFDYRLALEAIAQGMDGLRLNPGNIGAPHKVREVVKAASEREIPIRIGVNSGSLEKRLLEKYGAPTPEAMVESALGHAAILEDEGYDKIKFSLKTSDVLTTVEAYERLSQKTDYPLHVGITEAGTLTPGAVKSAVGIGLLLARGIGDTIRFSLTAPPELEVRAGFALLRSLGLRKYGVEVISCPTCSRTEIDLIGLAVRVEDALTEVKTPLKVAVMGCVVNGPGEAREADIGIAGGKGRGILFKKGLTVGTYDEADLFDALVEAVREAAAERSDP
jgi:(E)-4-hydroxy-3-methylbut-2-enyl-diphosphate synthase